MKAAIYNQEGKKMESEMVLPKEIFEVPVNRDLLYQVVVSQISNRRQKVAKTKDRSEVRGGGIKPWRQKGTGRARHGSIRSPLWIGGGVTFGPNLEQNFKKAINKKMRIKALFMVLSAKAKGDMLFIFDELNPPAGGPKTKPMVKLFDKVFAKKGSALIALPVNDNNLIKSIRNIKNIKVVQARELNALDLLNSKNLVLTKDSVKVLKETFVK